MKLFGLGAAAPLTLGAAMLAIVGKDTVSAEQAEAANTELAAAGITDAQLITKAAFTDLSEKAGRADKAETDLATEKGRADKAEADLASANKELATLRKLPGASHSNPTLEAGKTDVDAADPDAHQQAIDNLGHNKSLASHPLFGNLGRKEG